MSRPARLDKRIRMNRAFAIAESGATLVGRTKKGRNLYELGGGIFRGTDLIKARARFGIYKANIPRTTIKKAFGYR